jgi:diguanylate cyclase (GGDEF)-like protein
MRSAFRSPRAIGPVVSLALGWVLVNLVLGLAGMFWPIPEWVLWPAAVFGGATGSVACAVAAATGEGPVRAFWRRLSIAAGFMTGGTAAWTFDAVIADKSMLRMSPATGVLFVLAIGTAVTALVRLPSRRRNRRGTVALILDVAVVSVTAALVGSQFLSTIWIPGRTGPLVTALYLITMGTAGATVVAIIKVGMTGIEPVHPPALWTLAPIGLLGPVGFVFAPFIFHWPHLNPVVIDLPLAGLLFAIAARGQVRVNVTPPEPAPQVLPTDRPARANVWRRSVASVPYVSVAITVVILISATLRHGYLQAGLAAGSLALIILVVVRQLFAIADNTELMDRLADGANHDELTGLPNRRFFTAALNNRTAHTTVAVCDLDGFAALNDRLGDEYGDVILREAATRLALTVGAGAVVARLLGDEFGVLLPYTHPLANGTRLADVLLHAFRAPLHVEDRDLLVTVTVGVADGDGPAVPDLLRRAELGLQAARVAGGNRHQWYSPELDATAEHHARVAAALRQSLDRDEFQLLYQPIVELPSGAIEGVEALVRWHPDGGPAISPSDFIPVAEHTGLIVDLGAWVIETACADAARWQQEYGAEAPWISVNVSARVPAASPWRSPRRRSSPAVPP